MKGRAIFVFYKKLVNQSNFEKQISEEKKSVEKMKVI